MRVTDEIAQVSATTEAVKTELLVRLKRIEEACCAEQAVSDQHRDELTVVAKSLLSLGDPENAAGALWVREAKWHDRHIPSIVWTSDRGPGRSEITLPYASGDNPDQWISQTVTLIKAVHLPLSESFSEAYRNSSGLRGTGAAASWARDMRARGEEPTSAEMHTLMGVSRWCFTLSITSGMADERAYVKLLSSVKYTERDAVVTILNALSEAVGAKYIDRRHLSYALNLVRSGVETEHVAAWVRDMGETFMAFSDDEGNPTELWETLIPSREEAARAWYRETEQRLSTLLDVVRTALNDQKETSAAS